MQCYVIYELLSYFRVFGEVCVFHEPINPCGANFQQWLDAAKEAGYGDVVGDFQQMRDSHQHWINDRHVKKHGQSSEWNGKR